jgi:hypothetical protein
MVAARPEPLFDWFIPIDGDGMHLGTLEAERPPTFAYLREVVQEPRPRRGGVFSCSAAPEAGMIPCEAGGQRCPSVRPGGVAGRPVDLWRDGVVHPLRPRAGLALVLHHFRLFLLGGRQTVWVVGRGEPHKHLPFPDFAQFQVVDPDGLGQLLDEATHVVVLVLCAQAENQRFPRH